MQSAPLPLSVAACNAANASCAAAAADALPVWPRPEPEPESCRLKDGGRGSGGSSPDGCVISPVATVTGAAGAAADLKCHHGCFTHAVGAACCACVAAPVERHCGGHAPARLRAAARRGDRRAEVLSMP